MPQRQPAASVERGWAIRIVSPLITKWSSRNYEKWHVWDVAVKSDLFIVLRACASTGWVIMRSLVWWGLEAMLRDLAGTTGMKCWLIHGSLLHTGIPSWSPRNLRRRWVRFPLVRSSAHWWTNLHHLVHLKSKAGLSICTACLLVFFLINQKYKLLCSKVIPNTKFILHLTPLRNSQVNCSHSRAAQFIQLASLLHSALNCFMKHARDMRVCTWWVMS